MKDVAQVLFVRLWNQVSCLFLMSWSNHSTKSLKTISDKHLFPGLFVCLPACSSFRYNIYTTEKLMCFDQSPINTTLWCWGWNPDLIVLGKSSPMRPHPSTMDIVEHSIATDLKGNYCVCVHAHVTAHFWSEDNLWELVLPFYHVGPKNWTQVVNWLWTPLSPHLISLSLSFKKNFLVYKQVRSHNGILFSILSSLWDIQKWFPRTADTDNR